VDSLRRATASQQPAALWKIALALAPSLSFRRLYHAPNGDAIRYLIE
jgi:hypothetical protein